VDELQETGVFSLSVPRMFGGHEAAPVEIMRVIEAVAVADGSAGWCVMIANGSNIAAGYMTESHTWEEAGRVLLGRAPTTGVF
jgi:alkylation response protein AidB-like acyl-CoA dehydrogenase